MPSVAAMVGATRCHSDEIFLENADLSVLVSFFSIFALLPYRCSRAERRLSRDTPLSSSSRHSQRRLADGK